MSIRHAGFTVRRGLPFLMLFACLLMGGNVLAGFPSVSPPRLSPMPSAALDDVRIYNRVLTPAEIAGLTPQLKRRYTYGHDLISQTEVGTSTTTHYYGYDGHGSVGIVASKVIALAGRAIYGAEVETFAGSASAASRTAARRANAILEGGEAAVEAAAANQLAGAGRGYGYLDKMVPGTLKEGSIIYSTVPPNRIGGGLWATDGRAMVRAAGSSETYRIGTQTVKPRDMVYAYRVKTKMPCAAGNAEWNYQNGDGGFPQFYIQQEDVGLLEKVAEFLLQ